MLRQECSLSLSCQLRQEQKQDLQVPKLRESHFRKEMNRQIDNLQKVGIHKELGLSKREYRRSIPRLYVPQNGTITRYTEILLVDPRVGMFKLRDLLGINMTLHAPIYELPVSWKGKPPSMDHPHWFFWRKRLIHRSESHVEAYMRRHWRHLIDFEKFYLFIHFPTVALETEWWEIVAGRVTFYQPWGGVF